jgi:hypothetical protein
MRCRVGPAALPRSPDGGLSGHHPVPGAWTQWEGSMLEPQSLIAWIIIGAIAGWLAGLLVKRYGFGLVGNIVVGIVGAAIAAFFGVLSSPVRGVHYRQRRGRHHRCDHPPLPRRPRPKSLSERYKIEAHGPDIIVGFFSFTKVAGDPLSGSWRLEPQTYRQRYRRGPGPDIGPGFPGSLIVRLTTRRCQTNNTTTAPSVAAIRPAP